ncbi:hypothetical protein NL676_016205 [Syzygium grande]|nr:hypothetical protein NL676_016205 [Syzygium grande]
MVALAEVVFSELLKEGIEPDTRAYAEMLGAYLRADMIEKVMQTYEKMKATGHAPNEFTMMILIRNLEKVGEKDLGVNNVKLGILKMKFLTYVLILFSRKRRSVDLV